MGNFQGEDRILVVYKDGNYELTTFELTNRYEVNDILAIRKAGNRKRLCSSVHFDGEKQNYFVKRFQPEGNRTGLKHLYISETPGSKLVLASADSRPNIEIKITKGKGKDKVKLTEKIALADFIDLKGWKSLGNRLSMFDVNSVKLVESDPEPESPAAVAEAAAEEEEELFDEYETDIQEAGEEEESPVSKAIKDKVLPPPPSVKEDKTAKKGKGLTPGTELEWDLKAKTRTIKKGKKGKEPPQGKLF